MTEELGEDDAAYYHSLIGMLIWIVDIEQVYINTEVLTLSSHLDLPRSVHLDASSTS